MYQEINMLPKASSSSNMSGLIGGGGGIIWTRGEEFLLVTFLTWLILYY